MCTGLPLESCPTTARKNKGIFNIFILEWILRGVFLFRVGSGDGLLFFLFPTKFCADPGLAC